MMSYRDQLKHFKIEKSKIQNFADQHRWKLKQNPVQLKRGLRAQLLKEQKILHLSHINDNNARMRNRNMSLQPGLVQKRVTSERLTYGVTHSFNKYPQFRNNTLLSNTIQKIDRNEVQPFVYSKRKTQRNNIPAQFMRPMQQIGMKEPLLSHRLPRVLGASVDFERLQPQY